MAADATATEPSWIRVYLTKEFEPDGELCPTCEGQLTFKSEYDEGVRDYECGCSYWTFIVRQEPDRSKSISVPRWLYDRGVAAGGDSVPLPAICELHPGVPSGASPQAQGTGRLRRIIPEPVLVRSDPSSSSGHGSGGVG